MNKESKRLGRGLSSLLSSHNNRNDNPGDKTFKLINISSVKANSQQPRKNFAKEELENLSASIKSKGFLQPILVREKIKICLRLLLEKEDEELLRLLAFIKFLQ